jgi:hypothetical protein
MAEPRHPCHSLSNVSARVVCCDCNAERALDDHRRWGSYRCSERGSYWLCHACQEARACAARKEQRAKKYSDAPPRGHWG